MRCAALLSSAACDITERRLGGKIVPASTARLWLEILPGAAVFLGGVLLIIATAS